MARANECWGIEVGAYALKALHLARVGDQVHVRGYDVLRFSKVLTTPDLDVDEAIRINLDRFLSRHSIKGKTVVVSVPAGSMGFARFAKLPPVEPKRIPDIVRFEAQQQIPFPISEVEWDYHVFSQPDSPDVAVGLFAIQKERVQRFLENYRAVKMGIHGLTLSPVAMYNAMQYDMEITEDSPGMIFMDIGTSSTDVVIVDGGTIWHRTLPIGGNNFTDALVRAFKLSFPKAEKLKREAGTSKYARQIFQAMRPVFADLVQELQRSLGFYQSLNRESKLTKLVGFGSTFRLPGLQKFLRQQLQMDVVRLDAFEKLVIDEKRAADFADRTLNLATAYGLALQGLEIGQVDANLLPRDMIKQRIWKSKQPWFGAAAGLLVGATIWGSVVLSVKEREFQEEFQNSQPVISAAIGSAEDMVRAWNEIADSSDPRQRIENLRRVLDYRDIWPKLLNDLSMAVLAMNPQPELLASDYEPMMAIPRHERRIMHIDSLTAEYRFRFDDGSAGTTQQAEAMSISDIWGELAIPPDPETAEPAAPAPGAGGDTRAATKPPSFVITIKGRTPHRENPRLVSETFITWLRERESRERSGATQIDRPYTIEVGPRPIIEIKRVSESAGMAIDRARWSSRPAAEPAAEREAPRRPTGGMSTFRRPTGAPTAPTRPPQGAQSASPSIALDLGNLYPTRPIDTESGDADWLFEIRWTINLVPPYVARDQERDRDPQATPPAQGANAATTTPQDVQAATAATTTTARDPEGRS